MATPRGRFITFEGGEGAGKSTQIKRLAGGLEAEGIDVVVTREPGGSPLAEQLRQVILSGAAEAYGPKAEAMLFAAARADHIDRLIRPALDAGKWVLCDRFSDTTRAYQGAGGMVDAATIDLLERLALDGLTPDLTLLLDIPVSIGFERALARRGAGLADRFEREDRTIHEARRRAFLEIAARNPERVTVIDAHGSTDDVASAIWGAVMRQFF